MANLRSSAVIEPLEALFLDGTSAGLGDGELLDRYRRRQGEAAERAFAVLVDRHGPMVFRTCRAVLGADHDAQDAFQATFLVLARRAGTIRAGHSIAPWLHRVARRVAFRARSASIRRRASEVDAGLARRGHDEPRPLDDLGAILHAEIDRLPQPFREAVVLCDVEGLSHDEAAGRLGIPAGTLKSRQARARARLRDRLGRRGIAPSAAMAVNAPDLSLPPIPPGWTAVAARLATGTVPAGVAALARPDWRDVLMIAAKLAAATAALGLILAAAVHGRTQESEAPPPAAARDDAGTQKTKAPRTTVAEPEATPAPSQDPEASLLAEIEGEITAIEFLAEAEGASDSAELLLVVHEAKFEATATALARINFGINADLSDTDTTLAEQAKKLEAELETLAETIGKLRAMIRMTHRVKEALTPKHPELAAPVPGDDDARIKALAERLGEIVKGNAQGGFQ